jgi:hypothetical protein
VSGAGDEGLDLEAPDRRDAALDLDGRVSGSAILNLSLSLSGPNQ